VAIEYRWAEGPARRGIRLSRVAVNLPLPSEPGRFVPSSEAVRRVPMAGRPVPMAFVAFRLSPMARRLVPMASLPACGMHSGAMPRDTAPAIMMSASTQARSAPACAAPTGSVHPHPAEASEAAEAAVKASTSPGHGVGQTEHDEHEGGGNDGDDFASEHQRFIPGRRRIDRRATSCGPSAWCFSLVSANVIRRWKNLYVTPNSARLPIKQATMVKRRSAFAAQVPPKSEREWIGPA
jgi:hypothetical protein